MSTGRGMRVLFMTQYFPPETGAAPQRAYHFALDLVRAGHDVTVVTGMPNHPSGVKHRAYGRRLFARESRDGIRIIRSYLYATPRKTFATRMLNQISFMVSSVLAALFTRRVDAVVVTSPPLFLGLSAWLVSLEKRVPFVLDVRDYWPYAAVELGQLTNPRVIAMARGLESFLYRRAARIVAVTPGMIDLMVERGIPRHRIVLITNGADTDLFAPNPGAKPGNGSFTVLYSGTHGLVHGMDAIIDAAEILRRKAEVRILMVGDGVAKDDLVEESRRRGLDNVSFRPSEDPEALVGTIRGADLCLATTTAGSFGGGTIPVKLFDYMACARPIVAAVSGDAADVVREAGSGVVVEPGDGEGIANAVLGLIGDEERRDRMGRSGREYVMTHYSRRELAARMTSILEETVDAERAVGGGRVGFRAYLSAKYVLDAVCAAVAVVVLSPVFAAIALAIRLDSHGGAIYRQQRIGVHSLEFTILKFRTMQIDAPEIATDLMLEEDRDYTTRVGRILRKTSLDELPNLLNILRGEMSFVGPRPALYNQHELIEMRRRVRADLMRPGLTGWAQINGRDEISLDEKVRLDGFYVRNCSILLDVRILFRTFSAMTRGQGDVPDVRSDDGTARDDTVRRRSTREAT
ncbi:MAG: glycosyltransferase [Candidatus Eisenbacteria bacterium]|nr:glycosyltransferase [Candidatus Eisenbacteria bacterium]